MKKTSKGLVEYVKAQLGRPYWYGTFGQKSSKALYLQKKNQYPNYYTASDYSTQYGEKVHDCIGLIKGYIWSSSPDDTSPKYSSNGCPDINEEGMYNSAKVKGEISTMPEKTGILVFKPNHVGVYIGNGKVIEARGHAYGVVKTNLKDRDFTKWCECPYISYETDKTKEIKTVTVKTNGSNLNCRKRASVLSRVKGSFENGSVLTLISKKNKKWYKVKGKAVSGKVISGYCFAKWLKEAK